MKRFTETNKWEDPWFRKLTPKAKLLWQWLLDKCDAAGVIDADFDLATFQIGMEIDEQVLSELGDRIERLANGKFWMPSFVAFQYGQLSESCKPHVKVFRELEKHGLKQRVIPNLSKPHPPLDTKGIHTFEEEEEEEDKEKEKEKDILTEEGSGEKPTAAIDHRAWPLAIVEAYPRNEAKADALTIVAKLIEDGTPPEAMLAGTRAMAAAIAKLPSGANNGRVRSAKNFFLGRHWQDDPQTIFRGPVQSGNTSKPDLGGRRPSRTIHIPS